MLFSCRSSRQRSAIRTGIYRCGDLLRQVRGDHSGGERVTNEEFIARYSDWRSKYRQNLTDEEIAEELAFISELANTAQERLAMALVNLGSRAGHILGKGVEVLVSNEKLASLADVNTYTHRESDLESVGARGGVEKILRKGAHYLSRTIVAAWGSGI